MPLQLDMYIYERTFARVNRETGDRDSTEGDKWCLNRFLFVFGAPNLV